jgi:hypothetical protein
VRSSSLDNLPSPLRSKALKTDLGPFFSLSVSKFAAMNDKVADLKDYVVSYDFRLVKVAAITSLDTSVCELPD